MSRNLLPIERELKEHAALRDLQTLVDAGCNRDELLSLLQLAFWTDESWKTLVGMDLPRLKREIKQIRHCAEVINQLNRSGLIHHVSIESDRKAQPFLQGPARLDAPHFSPDSHWLAYLSDESGRQEAYVQPYPGPGGKWQISTEGGTEPVWNRNGRELFYRSGDKMMAADISPQPSFAAGKPRQLFAGDYVLSYAGGPFYDVSPDGQRFLMLKPVDPGGAPTQINVVLNWTEELKRLVPTRK
jgi:hypothetical protein